MVLPRRNWPRLVGSILITIAGIVGICNPKIASATIVVLIGAALMISGALRIGFYLSGSKLSGGWDMFTGILDIVGSFFILANGRATATFLTVLIGLYIILQGILGLGFGIRRRNLGLKYWSVGIAWGAVAIVLGILMTIFPAVTAIGLGALLGIFLLIMGILGIAQYIIERRDVS